MNNEERLIAKVISEKTLQPLLDRGVATSWFYDPQARTSFDFIVGHYDKYGNVPSKRTFLSHMGKTVKVVTIGETFDYLLDQMANTARWNHSRATIEDVSDLLNEGLTDDAVATLETGLEKVKTFTPGGWDSPEPLDVTPDPIPLGGLPEPLRDMVEAVAANVETPPEVALTYGLGTIAAATFGAWHITDGHGWDIGPPVLNLLGLVPSGERKSGAYRLMAEPLLEVERDLRDAMSIGIATERAKIKRLEKSIKQAEKDEDWALYESLSLDLSRIQPRHPLEIVIQDATTEALAQQMDEQRGMAAVFTTEGTAFATVAGGYRDDGKGNVGLINAAYDGERHRERRVGRGKVSIARPIMVWAACAQPDVMNGYATSVTEGSGFLARFVIFHPESMVGKRLFPEAPVPVSVATAWHSHIDALARHAWERYKDSTPRPGHTGHVPELTLSPDAADVMRQYNRDLEVRKAVELMELGTWAEKHPARVVRIAADFTLLIDPTATEIPLSQVEAAMTLAEPMLTHALAGLRVLRTSRGLSEDTSVVKALADIGKPQVTTQDVKRKVHGQSWVQGADDVRRALVRLEEHGYVRQEKVATGGRPSETWHVHPDVVSGANDGTAR